MENKIYELTNPQKSIWYTEEYYKGTPINNIIGCWNISENPNVSALSKAFNMLIKNNDTFRTRIIQKNNIVNQYFCDFSPIDIEIINIANLDEYNLFINRFSSTPFDVLNSFLYNAKILTLWDGSISFLMSIHHLIGDGWSLSLTLEDLKYYYQVALNDIEENAEKFSYTNFINSQFDYNNSAKFIKDKLFWEDFFSAYPETLQIKKSSNTSINSERCIYTFSDTLTKKIREFCRSNNISDYIFLLSTFSLYLRNLYDTKNYIVGNPVFNRANAIEKQTQGLFVSIMPFRIEVDDNLSFIDYCHKVSINQKSMYRHLKYPFHNILEYVRKKHNYGGSLYDCVFSYQNKSTPSNVKWIHNKTQAESLQIHIKSISNEKNDDLSIHYDFLVDVFNFEDIKMMHQRIEYMIEQILNNWGIINSEIEIITKDELNKVQNIFNNTHVDYNKNSNLAVEFEKIVEQYPDNIAVVDNYNSLTYKDLNNRANYIANIINSKYSDGDSSEIIAFALPRTINIYSTIFAILKAGKTYLPIDPEYPIERIIYMLSHSNARLLITTKEFYSKLNYKINAIFIEDLCCNTNCPNINIPISSSSNAYVMYTSGSTGIPKGVSIKHYNVLNFVKSMQSRLNYFPQNNNVLSVTTVSFDIFVFETFPTLLSGLKLIIADEISSRSPNLLGKLLQKYNITKILTTPSRIELLVNSMKNENYLSSLHEIILGGEPVPKQLVDIIKKKSSSKIYDLYGPTETTVYSTFCDITNLDEISIGMPINNTLLYILNSNNKLLPVNTIGEICIAGDGVGSGYYNNPEQTNKAFIKTQYYSGPIYKTGDLGICRSDGTYICLGRKDSQIKIRGYRIELDDIANNICSFNNIEKCIVIDRSDKDGKKYLCAYFISNIKINTSDLKKYLTKCLPNYMIPTHYIQLESFPLTVNHKIDKKSLPEPDDTDTISLDDFHAPQNDFQRILCNVISKCLNIEKISISQDIFDYNLDSLDIIQIQTKLLEYGIKLNTQDFYTNRTIEQLSQNINTTQKDTIKKEDTFTNINNSFISHTIPVRPLKKTYKNILLTGATGYLGIHILNDLLEKTSANIICTVRTKDISSKQRLENTYRFYFSKSIDFNRVRVLPTDITLKNLGIKSDEFNHYFADLDLIINTAANVRYYGLFDDFKKINIDVVKNLIDLTKKVKCKFIHISTMGLAGKYLISNNSAKNTFSEDDFYIGQNFEENVYLFTKSQAESIIYENANSDLDVSIIRVGNLTSRYSDGKFQRNAETNSFYNILKSIIKYKIIPQEILNDYIEFTPVDYCSEAIVTLLYNYDTNKRVFHIFNNNLIQVSNLIEILSKLGLSIQILSGSNFKKSLINLATSKNDIDIIKSLINELDDTTGITISSKIFEENNYTNSYLSKLSFKWPLIDTIYIEKLIKNMDLN